ncbi:MAG: hypothetical protein LBB50_01855 [Oscillospiraceae bacterium]|jgi:hypothetical protein|nr:hypothetical protein [Oscillospiraceae bacterium]
MTQYTILGRLRLMTALDDEGARNALPLCQAALLQLLPQVRRGANHEDPRLDQLAATAAFCMLLQRETTADEAYAGFKVGDISVTKKTPNPREGLARAEALRAQACAEARDLLCDTSFFAGTKAF